MQRINVYAIQTVNIRLVSGVLVYVCYRIRPDRYSNLERSCRAQFVHFLLILYLFLGGNATILIVCQLIKERLSSASHLFYIRMIWDIMKLLRIFFNHLPHHLSVVLNQAPLLMSQ